MRGREGGKEGREKRARERGGAGKREGEKQGEGFYVLDTLLYLHNSSAHVSRYSSNYKVMGVNIMNYFKLVEGKRERDGEGETSGG